jgi:hypothetical protein
MLICAAVAAVAILTSLRYLPGRHVSNAPSPHAPADAAPQANARR